MQRGQGQTGKHSVTCHTAQIASSSMPVTTRGMAKAIEAAAAAAAAVGQPTPQSMTAQREEVASENAILTAIAGPSGAGASPSAPAAGQASDSDEDSLSEGVVGARARAEFKYVTGNFSPQSVQGQRQPVDLRTPE